VQAAYELLVENALLSKCLSIRGREATKEELLRVHSPEYVDLVFSTASSISARSEFTVDTYANDWTAVAARLACGGVIDLATMVAKGDIRNAFALLRPPGHHCERDKQGGFCIFNNVAVAVAHLQKELGIQKILIVDWDVHHGNGVQQIFYSDPTVLYMSLHRYEHAPGLYYPDDGKADRVGEGAGEGRNINFPFPYLGDGYGDHDYVAVFRELFVPVALEFGPEMVIVCAGFDAAEGDPMGGFHVSPQCFGTLTSLLLPLAQGKIVLSLEGGYNPPVVAACVEACVRVLLGESGPTPEYITPHKQTVECIANVKAIHSKYWQCLQ